MNSRNQVATAATSPRQTNGTTGCNGPEVLPVRQTYEVVGTAQIGGT